MKFASTGPIERHLRSALRGGLLLVALALTAPAAMALTLEEQRAEYRAALADLYAVRLNDFESRLDRLADYPLLPYLHYQRLMRYISTATPEEIQAFRTRFAATPLADTALRQWLDNLARRGDWVSYRAHYDPEVARGTEFECRWYRALLETGDRDRAFAGARQLWLVDHSQPKVCDPLFKAWQAADGIDDELAWQRLHITIAAGRTGLGSYLSRFLKAGDTQRLAEEYLTLHRSPHRLARLESIPGGDGGTREAQVVAHALQRLARRDAGDAETQWQRWRERLSFTPHQAAAVREDILRYAARQGDAPELLIAAWPPAELAGEVAADLVEELARDAISGARWDLAAQWIGRLPDWAQARPVWQYWSARTEQEMNRIPASIAAVADTAPTSPGDDRAPDAAAAPIPWTPVAGSAAASPAAAIAPATTPGVALQANTFSDAAPPFSVMPVPEPAPEVRLAALAQQRNYYGFMAADRVGRPYALQAAANDVSDAEINALKSNPAVIRAIELRAIGELPEGRRELRWLMDRLDDRALLTLAEYARRVGWHRQSIQATIIAEHWDHVDLRFPLAYADTMIANARARDLPPNWLFAVARQESAFMSDARSGAGALGVMQVMPATARQTARRNNIPLSSNWQLLDEATNIDIGSRYLRQMYERYDRNRILASAAYNAGPGRVDRWVKEHDPNPADEFIEGIPFRETRGYVQNILSFSLIYAMRLGEEQPFLYANEQ